MYLTKYFYNLLFAFLFTALSISAYGQKWEKYYSTTRASAITSSVESYDKGFYLGGVSSEWILIYKTDINGKILWQREIGDGNESPIMDAMWPTKDGGLMVSGHKSTDFNDTAQLAFILKLDACGQKIWSKIYTIGYDDDFGDIAMMKNGDFIFSFDFAKNGIKWRSCVIRTDSIGNLKWQSFNDVIFGAIFIDKNENILSTGIQYLPLPNNPNVNVINSDLSKTTSIGSVAWSSYYSLCAGYATQQINDTSYLTYMSGYLNDGTGTVMFVKSDTAGKAFWRRLIGDTERFEFPIGMVRLNDSTLFLAAYSQNRMPDANGINRGYIKFMLADLDGNIKKQGIYKNPHYSTAFYKITPTSDGKYLLSGYVADSGLYGFEINEQPLVIKINSNLDLDTFDNHDADKYNFLCQNHLPLDTSISFSGSDTVHITIPPNPRTSSVDYNSNPIKNDVFLSPNPVTGGSIQVQCPAGNSNATLTMYDVLGRLIHTYTCVPGDTGHTNIDLGNIASGCYIMVLWQDGKRYVQKVIVQ